MKNLLLTLCILIATVILAGSTAYANTWSGDVQVAAIEASDTGAGGGVWLRFTTDPFPNHSCAFKAGQYMLGGSSENIRRMSALATSARLSARPVRVIWSGGCNGPYPLLVGIELR
jgi:hypothetical protein